MGERGWNERNPCVDPSAYLPSTIVHVCTSNIFLHDLTDISLHFLWYSFHDVPFFCDGVEGDAPLYHVPPVGHGSVAL